MGAPAGWGECQFTEMGLHSPRLCRIEILEQANADGLVNWPGNNLQ